MAEQEQEPKVVTTRDMIEHQRERRKEYYKRLRERSKIIVDGEEIVPKPRKKGERE